MGLIKFILIPKCRTVLQKVSIIQGVSEQVSDTSQGDSSSNSKVKS